VAELAQPPITWRWPGEDEPRQWLGELGLAKGWRRSALLGPATG